MSLGISIFPQCLLFGDDYTRHGFRLGPVKILGPCREFILVHGLKVAPDNARNTFERKRVSCEAFMR